MDAMGDAPVYKVFLVAIKAFTIISIVCRPSNASVLNDEDPDYEDVLLRLDCGTGDDDYEECAKRIILGNESTTKSHNAQRLKHCESFRKDLIMTSGTYGAPYDEEMVNMVLVWRGVLEYAAAALLRATLLSEGYSHEEIKFQNESNDMAFGNNSLTVMVNLAWKLYVRLAPRAIDKPSCTMNATRWSFYKNVSTPLECAFTEPGTNESKIDIYILKEFEHDDVADVVKDVAFAPTSQPQLNLIFIERMELKTLLLHSNNSFLFVDAIRGIHTSEDIKIMQVPLCSPAEAKCSYKDVSLRVLEELPPRLSKIFKLFSPNLEDLDSVLAISEDYLDLPEAACKWASLQLELIFRSNIKWVFPNPATDSATSILTDWVAVVLPWEESSLKEYLYLVHLLKTTKNFPSKIKINVFIPRRFDSQWVFRKLIHWFSVKGIAGLKGVVLSSDMAAEVRLLADKLNIPLLTYDVPSKPCEGSSVVTATGRREHLELALHRLFADCKWRRLAVLSESLRLYVELNEALRAPSSGLIIREVYIKTNLLATLQDLKEADVRVFLVNTGATMASVVLTAAHRLNMTREAGFLWIVREYNMADNATAVVRPISVSFWWRDHDTVKTDNDQKRLIKIKKTSGNTSNAMAKIYDSIETLRTHMEERWRGRTWPLHAAPLVDALLSLAAGFTKTTRSAYNVPLFWFNLQDNNITGLVQKLVYDNEGVKAPLVFIEEWGADPRPRLLATWHGGERSAPNEECPVSDPPSDGSIVCYKPEGDPFQPTCRDAMWITSITSIVCVTTAVVLLAAWASRRALASRENRYKVDFAKRLLARRERIFAELAEHLVDRLDLELQQELGTGRFGCVKLGVLRERGRKRGTVVVAAKALRDDAAPAEESEFLKEACILAGLDHEHIVRFIGVCVVDGPPLLLMEYAFFGDLLRYLQTRRHLAEGVNNTDTSPNMVVGLEERAYVSAEALTRLAQEAAGALAYLAQRKLVHRDVRASNCLVDERRSLKLADFGLARTTGTVDGEYACRRRGLFPVLWMAPESLASGVSSAASDVWAFGVLVFELVTLGRRPYGDMPPPSVLQYVMGGGRPQLPWDASAETRALLRACWRRAPEERPQVERLQRWLEKRRRALRPALAAELVDVNDEVFGDSDLNEPDLSPDITA